MASLEERVSYLEGAHTSLATKADVAELRAELKADIARVETTIIKWIVGTMISSVAVACTLTLVIDRLLG
ncbi:MAG: hypothetical protein F4X65_02275 [Chloroflexi bacterium]|nr:hypothetical protein [Chloroflexota bacterium]